MNDILKIAIDYYNDCINHLEKFAYIRKLPNGKYRVFSEKGKNMGTYKSRSEAKDRLKAIEYFKHQKADDQNAEDKVIDLTDADDFSYSAIMRKMRQKASKEEVKEFLILFKKQFDNAVKKKSKNPEKVSLHNSLIKFNRLHKIKIKKKLVKQAHIQRFIQVTPNIYRGSAPSPKDVEWLHDKFGIKKIISLDQESGDRIDRACKLLGINHVMLPIDISNLHKSLLSFLKNDIKGLLENGGPTFIHCAQGKDRTGLAIALYKCKYMGMDPREAIEEAKSLGFGVGVDPKVISLFEKVIKSCQSGDDNSAADIVSNERQYIGDNRDSYLDEGRQMSFAPYLTVTKEYPYDGVYKYIDDQSPTRENYHPGKSIKKHDEEDVIPQVGVYDNEAGIGGASVSEQVGGFLHD
jgi:protein tyrosine/serine phosphatase